MLEVKNLHTKIGEKEILMSRHHILPFLLMFLLPLVAGADNLSVIRVEAERLPDMNIPRAGHAVFCVNGELTVAGGHTTGFVPTPTAEYLKDGKWHLMQMFYNHDFGMAIKLKSGKMLLAGGAAENIGVGQTFTAELYDPVTHSFDGFGSMDVKRAKATAQELDSGLVVVSGNWHYDDGIEVFDGQRKFTYIKDMAVHRAYPFIFRIANDDVMILGGLGSKGDSLYSPVAERLRGDTLHIPLLETWKPITIDGHSNSEGFIGDEDKGVYVYLMAVENRDGQAAIARVQSTTAGNGTSPTVTLLPTVCPVPMQSHGEQIEYVSSLIVDRQSEKAYMVALPQSYHQHPEGAKRIYVLCVDYAQRPKAGMTLYYTDPIPDVPPCYPVLDGDGNLLLAGGTHHGSNFTPSGDVWLLRVGRKPAALHAGSSHWPMALLILVALLLAGACAYLFIYKKRRESKEQPLDTVQDHASPDSASAMLMQRINQVMEEQKLYRNSELKLQDLAAVLGTNRRFVSDCINSQMGCTFSQYVNIYRINYAKHVLRQRPDKKIADVYIESGFANEMSFYRTFKSVTGMTPKEWLNQKIY